jgi:hypothetical protein
MNECNLVSQLREKQKQLQETNSFYNRLDKHRCFLKFILEEDSRFMGYYYSFLPNYLTTYTEFYEGLSTENKEKLIDFLVLNLESEKLRNSLYQDIANMKNQLGII